MNAAEIEAALKQFKHTNLKRKIFKVSNLEIDLLRQALESHHDLTLTSPDATETASSKDLSYRMLLLRAGTRLDATAPHSK
jgi:hypothetical protein